MICSKILMFFLLFSILIVTLIISKFTWFTEHLSENDSMTTFSYYMDGIKTYSIDASDKIKKVSLGSIKSNESHNFSSYNRDNKLADCCPLIKFSFNEKNNLWPRADALELKCCYCIISQYSLLIGDSNNEVFQIILIMIICHLISILYYKYLKNTIFLTFRLFSFISYLLYALFNWYSLYRVVMVLKDMYILFSHLGYVWVEIKKQNSKLGYL